MVDDDDGGDGTSEPMPSPPQASLHVAAAAGGLRWGRVGSGDPRRCSFCGRRDQSVGHLVRSRTASICDRCVVEIGVLLSGADTGQRSMRFKPALSGPADRAAAERDIEAAYEQVFDDDAPPDRRASAIEDGANLVESILEAERRAPVRGDIDVFVDYIRFIDENEAEVRFTLTLGGAGLPQLNETGFAELTDNRWRMARSTWCSLAGRVGVQCPPPPSAGSGGDPVDSS